MKKLHIPESGKPELILAGTEFYAPNPEAEIDGISILISGSKLEQVASIDIYMKEGKKENG